MVSDDMLGLRDLERTKNERMEEIAETSMEILSFVHNSDITAIVLFSSETVMLLLINSCKSTIAKRVRLEERKVRFRRVIGC